MTTPFTPLSDDELQRLDDFLLYEVQNDEVMTLEILDGYLHAIAIGPTSLAPKQWMPAIWGESESIMPPMESMEKLNEILGLVMRLFNSIVAGLEADPPEFCPNWCTQTYRGKEYDVAEGWAYGFWEGMKLRWPDWQPMLQTQEGQALYRPIGMLGEDEFSPDQDARTKTPVMRHKLALQIPDAIVGIYKYWLPHRQAVHERHIATTLQKKVGRNDPCPCGSGIKFKKCCGSAANLH